MSNCKELLDAALAYARLGWHVVAQHNPVIVATGPACSCGDEHCNNIGKHPQWDPELLPNGVHSATVDQDAIKAWYRRWPNANLAIMTGRQSRLIVLDVDPDNGGRRSLEILEAKYGRLPHTVIAKSGRGLHFYFLHPEGRDVPNDALTLGGGVEVKSDGSGITAPPSMHYLGNFYFWLNDPEDTPLAELPEWIIDALNKPKAEREAAALAASANPNGRLLEDFSLREKLRRCQACVDHEPGAPEGDRGRTLVYRIANVGLDFALERDEFHPIVMTWAERCKPPIEEREVDKALKWAYSLNRIRSRERNGSPPGCKLLHDSAQWVAEVQARHEREEKIWESLINDPEFASPPPNVAVGPPDASTAVEQIRTLLAGATPMRLEPESPRISEPIKRGDPRIWPTVPDDAPWPDDADDDDAQGSTKGLRVTVTLMRLKWLPRLMAYWRNLNLYRRGDDIVRVAGEDDETDDGIATVFGGDATAFDVFSESTGVSFFRKDKKEKEILALLSPVEIKAVRETALGKHIGLKGLQPLTQVRRDPVVTAQGKICSATGYHNLGQHTGAIIKPGGATLKFPGVDAVTLEEAQLAYATLTETLVDYPFQDRQLEVFKCIALTVTVAARSSIDTCPLWAITANIPRAGKGYLSEGLFWLAGSEPEFISATRDHREDRKAIDAVLMARPPALVIDECNAEDGVRFGQSIKALATKKAMKVRKLCESAMALIGGATIVGLGNQLVAVNEVRPRVVPIVLKSNTAKPNDRDDFEYSAPGGWLDALKADEVRLKSALWTLVSWCLRHRGLAHANFASGPGRGSYPQWAGLIGPLLVVSGNESLLARETWHTTDAGFDEGAATVNWAARVLATLVEASPGSGITATQIAERLASVHQQHRIECPVRGWKEKPPSAREVARELNKYEGRPVIAGDGSEIRLVRTPDDNNVNHWSVEVTKPAHCRVAPDRS